MKDIIAHTQALFNRVGLPHRMVNGGVFAQMGKFEFTFRNYYTVVDGPVPLKVAEEIYAIPYVGKSDIRSGGDCGCREPSTWATAFNGSKIVVTPKETANIKEMTLKGSEIAKAITSAYEKYQLCETEEEYATYPKYVETYHIDSELGLYIFIQTLKKHNLI